MYRYASICKSVFAEQTFNFNVLETMESFATVLILIAAFGMGDCANVNKELSKISFKINKMQNTIDNLEFENHELRKGLEAEKNRTSDLEMQLNSALSKIISLVPDNGSRDSTVQDEIDLLSKDVENLKSKSHKTTTQFEMSLRKAFITEKAAMRKLNRTLLSNQESAINRMIDFIVTSNRSFESQKQDIRNLHNTTCTCEEARQEMANKLDKVITIIADADTRISQNERLLTLMSGKAHIVPFPRGRIYIGRNRHPVRSRTSVEHGTRVRQTCDGTSELYSTAEKRYLDINIWNSVNENGTWTPALAECVIKRCETASRPKRRFVFTNGTATDDKVDFDTILHTYCIERYDFEDEFQGIPAVARCGTRGIIRGVPNCVPAFCSMTLDRTLYLDQGTAFAIVDDIGRIASSTKVFFRCTNSQDYELFLDDYIDEVTDTCYFGDWKKKRIPVCKEKRCYLKVYRGAIFSDLNYNMAYGRSTYVESQKKIHISCITGFRLVDEDNHPVTLNIEESFSSCSKGKWLNILHCKPEPCKLAYDDSHMEYKRGVELVTSGSEVKDGQTITASCDDGFHLQIKQMWVRIFYATCSEGEWSEKLFPECIEVPCSLSMDKGSNYWTIDEGVERFIHTSGEIPSNTRVYIGCRDGYYEFLAAGKPVSGEHKYSECRKGVWSPIYQCKLSMNFNA